MAGRVFAVVGPSGVGKDTLMAAVGAARPGLVLVRRVITRPEAAGGEPFEGVSAEEFARRADKGDFALDWQAHGLNYGIPAAVRDALARGSDVLVNLSRAVLPEAARAFPGLTVVHVTARPEVLAQRLAARGRENGEEITRRLSRTVPPLPAGLPVIEIDNSGRLDEAVVALLAALDPVKA